MTGVVQADLVGERAQRMAYFHDVVEELYHIHDLTRSHTFMLAFQQTGIVQLDESRAADRRGDNVVEALELIFKFLCQRNRLLLETGIGHRLTAARLVERIIHVKTQMLQ